MSAEQMLNYCNPSLARVWVPYQLIVMEWDMTLNKT